MDEATVTAHLSELRERLELVDEEREVLVNLIRGYEGWLRLHNAGPRQLAFVPPSKPRRGRPPRVGGKKGVMSIRQAVIKTLKETHGEPIHAKTILERIAAMGIAPNAKDPTGVIDLTCFSLGRAGKPVERVAPRTWRWTEAS